MSANPVTETSPHKILIVDDTPANLGVIVESLEERGIIEAKGIGALHTWFLTGRSSTLSG